MDTRIQVPTLPPAAPLARSKTFSFSTTEAVLGLAQLHLTETKRKAMLEQREALVARIAALLQHEFWRNAQTEPFPEDKSKITAFHAQHCATISIADYFKRLAQYLDPSNEALVLSLIYIYRYQKNNLVDAHSIHRLILLALLAAVKFQDDVPFNNYSYAKVGGLPLKELNTLEADFMGALNFDLMVDLSVYQGIYNCVASFDLNAEPAALHCAYPMIPLPEDKKDLAKAVEDIQDYEFFQWLKKPAAAPAPAPAPQLEHSHSLG